MKFAVGADHAGYNYRERLIEYLESEGHEVEDFGTKDDESCDYPEYAHRVAERVASHEDVRGLLVCGSGQGMVMTANRYDGVRAALCLNGEMARKTREHNNANCLVLAERSMPYEDARDAVDQFISTSFDGGRHERRIGKIDVPPLKISTNPLLKARLTELRDRETSYEDFNEILERTTELLFAEVSRTLPSREKTVQTPLAEAEGRVLDGEILVVPIIRAGLGMLKPVRDMVPESRVAHLGFTRDEETFESEEYYRNLPDGLDDPTVIVVDPMLATGGTADDAISVLKEKGYDNNIRLLCLVAAPEGVRAVHENHESVSIWTAALDERLNEDKFIVPGLGDAGDRLYATE